MNTFRTIRSLHEEILDGFWKVVHEEFGTSAQQLGAELIAKITMSRPPRIELGDFSIPCFPLSKALRAAPDVIAGRVAQRFAELPLIEWARAEKGFVNIKMKNEPLFAAPWSETTKDGGTAFGRSTESTGRRVMVEYLSPNTNKPLHLGHVRNGTLGMAVSNALGASGHTVVRANLVNDRGVHICKSMLAWQKWGNGETPASRGMKGDHFVGELYVLYSRQEKEHPELEAEIHEMLRKWEMGDPEIKKLWETMNGWVYAGFEETYRMLGFVFDTFYYESDTYTLGKDIVQEGLSRGIFVRTPDGAVVVPLPADQFGKDEKGKERVATVLRSDGTSVYLTQDLGTAVLKFDEHHLDQSIYVVADEQNNHFQTLFAILRMLGYSWADQCFHLSYGMVELPEGRMKSREGTVVDADDLVAGMTELAKQEIGARLAQNGTNIPAEELETRARKIALAAIKFYLLNVDPRRKIRFDPKESLAFEGRTGPYCQYAFARCSSILRKAALADPNWQDKQPDFSVLGNTEELLLVQRVSDLPQAIERTARSLNPSILCEAVYGIAQALSQFYHQHNVIGTEDEKARIARLHLIRMTGVALERGLELLGIEVIEEM